MLCNTFSIAAYDPDEGAFGVAVASKFLAVGAVVSWAQTGVGAVATQSYVKIPFGPDGLKLMGEGKSAQEALDTLLAADDGRELRQVGMVDAHGGAATFTGKECFEWAGGKTGEGYAVQGNILTGADVIDAMVDAYLTTKGELAARLVAALTAGDNHGGDKRGKQAAAVKVVKPNGGYGGDNEFYLDLRVDDHPDPVNRLNELLGLHHLFFGEALPEDQLSITEDLARELQGILAAQGFYKGAVDGDWGTVSKQAFWALVGNENLEERWSLDRPDQIDRVALDYIRKLFG